MSKVKITSLWLTTLIISYYLGSLGVVQDEDLVNTEKVRVKDKSQNYKRRNLKRIQFKKEKKYIESLKLGLLSKFKQPNFKDFNSYRGMAETWEQLKTLSEEQLFELYFQLKEENKADVEPFILEDLLSYGNSQDLLQQAYIRDGNERGLDLFIIRALFMRMGQVNPSRTLELAAKEKKSFLSKEVMKSWSKESPIETVEWLKDNHKKLNSINPNYRSLFSEITKKSNAVEAYKHYEELKLSQNSSIDALHGIVHNLQNNKDFIYIKDAVKESKNKRSRTIKLQILVSAWAKKFPIEAFEFANANGITHHY